MRRSIVIAAVFLLIGLCIAQPVRTLFVVPETAQPTTRSPQGAETSPSLWDRVVSWLGQGWSIVRSMAADIGELLVALGMRLRREARQVVNWLEDLWQTMKITLLLPAWLSQY